MLFVVSAVLFDMLKARQLACVSKSGQKCPAAQSLSSRRAWIEMLESNGVELQTNSRSPHGERGLKFKHRIVQGLAAGRSPHGERGLKFALFAQNGTIGASLSSRRAWIEIISGASGSSMVRSLSSRRAWIEIVGRPPDLQSDCRRSPHGERGLK